MSAEPTSMVETGSRRLIIVVGVMLAALLQTLDSTITNVALPNIQGNLGASTDEVFDINVVPGVASFLILLFFLRDPDRVEREPLDVPGLLFLVVGIGSL